MMDAPAIHEARYELAVLRSVWIARRWRRARVRCDAARAASGMAPMEASDRPLYCWYEA